MGDPECQTILPRLRTDFFEIIKATIDQKLNHLDINWNNSKTLSIVQCSDGYPENYSDNHEIKNLDKATLTKDEFIFHAGTKIDGNKVLSKGGRVLNFVAKSESFKTSREMAINLIKRINWENGFYRKDIGFKVIDE